MVKNATISPKVKFECLQHLIVDQCPPEQISGTMKRKGVSVSHTTVDKWVVEDKAVGGALFKQLCHNGRKRSPYKGVSACNIPTRTSIKDRPAEAVGRRFGDWKMNLIIGKNGCQAILVLVEWSTSYVIS
jgi:IS30 family transposase